jgi:hypothetical protein
MPSARELHQFLDRHKMQEQRWGVHGSIDIHLEKGELRLYFVFEGKEVFFYQ